MFKITSAGSIMSSLTNALASSFGGNGLQGTVGAGLAPLGARLIGSQTEDGSGLNVVLHAAFGALIGQLTTGNATSGAIGEGVSAAIAPILQDVLYGQQLLSESDKANLVSLTALISGTFAMAAAGDGDAQNLAVAMGQGSRTAKDATENNFLHYWQYQLFADMAKGCEQRGDCAVVKELVKKTSLEQQEKLIQVCSIDV